jgi:hypothetical protein
MAGHSWPKDGVASLAYVPAIPIPVATQWARNRDARHKAGHDVDAWFTPTGKCSNSSA